MNTEMQWLEAGINIEKLQSIKTGMLGNSYSAGKSSGFLLEIATESCLEGRYIEWLIDDFVINDSLSERVEKQTTVYVIFFRISIRFPQIEICNNIDTTQSFFSRLSEYCGFHLTIKPIKIDPLLWFESMEHSNSKGLILGLWSSNITVSNSATKSFSLKGTSDLRQIFTDMEDEDLKHLRKVYGEIDCQTFKLRVGLNADASASIDNRMIERKRSIIRNALIEANEKPKDIQSSNYQEINENY